MRIHIGVAIAAALTIVSSTRASADDWCGYAAGDTAVIECGYTTLARCEGAIGKGGMCFVDPDTALNVKRAMPAAATKILGNGLERASGRG
jgi:hypothetical protein